MFFKKMEYLMLLSAIVLIVLLLVKSSSCNTLIGESNLVDSWSPIEIDNTMEEV